MLWSLLFITVIGLRGTIGKSMDTATSTASAPAHCNSESLVLNGSFTSQSTTYTDDETKFTSDRAVDGDEKTCAHTLKIENSWWRIDLLGVYHGVCITIYNTEKKYTNLLGAQIHIGNSREDNSTSNSIDINITRFQQEALNHYEFDPEVSGRYITVLFPEVKHMILCDVKISGTMKNSPYKLIKKQMTWVDALYYCRQHHRDLAAILDDEDQALAELEARMADTDFVWLGLHYTCTLDFWFWVNDNTVVFEHWAPHGCEVGCYMSGAMMRKEDHYWFINSDDAKFNFLCEK